MITYKSIMAANVLLAAIFISTSSSCQSTTDEGNSTDSKMKSENKVFDALCDCVYKGYTYSITEEEGNKCEQLMESYMDTSTVDKQNFYKSLDKCGVEKIYTAHKDDFDKVISLYNKEDLNESEIGTILSSYNTLEDKLSENNLSRVFKLINGENIEYWEIEDLKEDDTPKLTSNGETTSESHSYIYKGKNIYFMNPSLSDGSYAIKFISINNKEIDSGLYGVSSFEIPLEDFNIEDGSQFELKITFDSAAKPKLLNPEDFE